MRVRKALSGSLKFLRSCRADVTAHAPGALRKKKTLPARLRKHADNRHHAEILMIENVAVLDEVADCRPAEIHLDLDVCRIAFAVPIGHLEDIVELLLLFRNLDAIDGFHQEVDLMHVEFMDLRCAVLDRPFLHGAPCRRYRRWRVGIEDLLLLSIDRDEERCAFMPTCAWRTLLGEIKKALGRDLCIGKIVKPHPAFLRGRRGHLVQCHGRAVRDDLRQRARRIAIAERPAIDRRRR